MAVGSNTKRGMLTICMRAWAALAESGDLSGAIASYRDAIRLNPEDSDSIGARYVLGRTLAESGDVAGAIAAFREAIQHDPRSGQFRLLRTILMVQRPKDAVTALRRVRDQARDDGTIGQAIDLATAQYSELSMQGVSIPRIFGLSAKTWSDDLPGHYYDERLSSRPRRRSGPPGSRPIPSWPTTWAQCRYNAACSAALAAAGKGIDKPPLDDQAKTRWRHQALEWLKADLTYWAKQAESGEPEAKALANQDSPALES